MASIITDECQHLILILLCFFAFFCFILFFTKPTHAVHLPPSPPSLPVIGHLHHLLFYLLDKRSFSLFDILPHKFLHTLSSKYGTLLHLRVPFFPFILVSSASVAYEIFTAHDVNVSSRNLPTNEGSVLFDTSGFVTAPYGEYFKFMKKLIVTKLLGPNALVQSRSIRADELERLRGNLLTKLLVNVYAVMRDPNVWQNPLEFKPERFLTSLDSGKEEERKRQALKYLPFGSGRRGCPASSLAYMIVGTTIGMLVQWFDWRIKGEKVNTDECYKEFTQTLAYL